MSAMYQLSNLEHCWLQGFKAFHQRVDELTNPHAVGSKEAHYWREGWWEAFYNTQNLSDAYCSPNAASPINRSYRPG